MYGGGCGVFVYGYAGIQMCAHVYTCEGQRLILDVFHYYPPYFVETWRLVNLKLFILTGLAGQETPGICLFLLPQNCG